VTRRPAPGGLSGAGVRAEGTGRTAELRRMAAPERLPGGNHCTRRLRPASPAPARLTSRRPKLDPARPRCPPTRTSPAAPGAGYLAAGPRTGPRTPRSPQARWPQSLVGDRPGSRAPPNQPSELSGSAGGLASASIMVPVSRASSTLGVQVIALATCFGSTHTQ